VLPISNHCPYTPQYVMKIIFRQMKWQRPWKLEDPTRHSDIIQFNITRLIEIQYTSEIRNKLHFYLLHMPKFLYAMVTLTDGDFCHKKLTKNVKDCRNLLTWPFIGKLWGALSDGTIANFGGKMHFLNFSQKTSVHVLTLIVISENHVWLSYM
jgi:hypothetical protein